MVRPVWFSKTMLTRLEKKVADYIESERLLSPAQKVLLAVSGGADSMAMLHIIARLRADGVLKNEICCAHINHRLRGREADADEQFVIDQCRWLGLPVVTERIDVPGFAKAEKLSIETSARKLRIEKLLDIASRQNCGCIATAHQKNDNAETILQRLIRGTGLRGLCGIWPEKEFAAGVRFVRPLLCIGRPSILEYLNEQNIKWCEDRTNLDCSYRRNFIRNRLLPALQKNCTADTVELLDNLAKSARRLFSRICNEADAVWPDVADINEDNIALDFAGITGRQPEVKMEIIRRALAAVGCGEQNLKQTHYEKITELCDNKNTGKALTLPAGFEAKRDYAKLIISRTNKQQSRDEQLITPVELQAPGKTELDDYTIEADIFEKIPDSLEAFKKKKDGNIEWFDFDKLKLPLRLRHRRDGDRFMPLGMAEEKKLGKFLTAVKTPRQVRQRLLVIEDGEKIVWLWPVRISERAKITGQTKKILQLKIISR